MTRTLEFSVQTVSKPQLIAAASREVQTGDIPAAFGPALAHVKSFLARHEDIRALAPKAHEVFLYRHADSGTCSDPMTVYFGVEVARTFDPDPDGEVQCVEVPVGQVVTVVHKGAYRYISNTHAKVRAWIEENGWKSAGWSWEIYGDERGEEEEWETGICYLIKRAGL
ncbi:hypothetical protein M427DRAFT_57384 [Gonapodya prolifera JEL478]|uniref:AraC effector-binding domain-containing protein n=1 Tax=Gonapodya prolifera (strain JEL478) TaxID=1344416 RepID=A0A139AD55_GONPJ|nr:hypothetical protein M427DRAFT_57384 [Gonapodya prolifera JEL478]|eukprot:KXS14731.1 hypothetical protein M427DRAFT_57384 [Gonapodya prolifera JEL478]